MGQEMLVATLFLVAALGSGGADAPAPSLPAGTHLAIVISKTVKVRTTRVGDVVHAKVLFPLFQQGKVVIPSGAEVTGRVMAVRHRDRHEDESFLRIRFERVEWNQGSAELNAYMIGRLPDQKRVRSQTEYNPASCNGEVASAPDQQVRSNNGDTRRPTAPVNATSELYRPPRSCSPDGPTRETRAEPVDPVRSDFEDVFVRALTKPAGATELMSPSKNVKLPKGTLVELQQVGP